MQLVLRGGDIKAGPVASTTGIEAVWPEVARELELRLRKRGLDRATALDVVQEVAARVLVAAPSFDSAPDLLPWATTVARRLVIDLHRSGQRLVHAEDGKACGSDVEAQALSRLELDAVRRAFAGLTPEQRKALAQPGEVPADHAEQVRIAVRRHRARTHLARLLEGRSPRGP